MDPLVFVLFIIFIVVGIPVICGSIVSMNKMGRGKRSRSIQQLDAEETRLMQEIHQSLSRMEKRVEALETIIINKK